MSTTLSGLARRLIDEGLLESDQAEEAAREATRHRTNFVSHVVAEGLVEDRRLASFASLEFGAPYLNLEAFDESRIPSGLISEKLIKKHNIIPLLKRGNRLFVAVSDPFNFHALDEIKFHAGMSVDPIVVDESVLNKAIESYLSREEEDGLADAFGDLEDGLEALDIESIDEDSLGEEEI